MPAVIPKQAQSAIYLPSQRIKKRVRGVFEVFAFRDRTLH